MKSAKEAAEDVKETDESKIPKRVMKHAHGRTIVQGATASQLTASAGCHVRLLYSLYSAFGL